MTTFVLPRVKDIDSELHSCLVHDYKLFQFIQQELNDGLSYWRNGPESVLGFDRHFWLSLGYAGVSLKPEINEIMSTDDQSFFIRHLEMIASTNVIVKPITLSFAHRQGHMVIVRCRFYISLGASDNSSQIVGAYQKFSVPELSTVAVVDQKNKNQLHSIALDLSPNAVILVESNGKIVLVNKHAEQLFQYTSNELVNQPIDILLPDSVCADHPALLSSYFDNPTERVMGAGRDLAGQRKDGSQVPIEIGLSPFDDGPNGTLVIASIVDISERKFLEQRFRQAIEAAPTAMIMVDSNGMIVLVNRQTEKLFGFGRHELMSKPVDMLTPENIRSYHPELLANFFKKSSVRSMGAGRDLMGQRKDGTLVPIEIGLNPIEDVDGKFVIASVVDISERKLLEQRFRLAIEAAPTAMVMINELGFINLVNQQTERLFGYDRNELLNQSIEILLPESVRLAHPKHLKTFFESPETRLMGSGRELTGRRKDGSEFPIEIGLNPISEGNGVHVIASVTDITVRANHNKSIEKYTKDLERSIKELDNYAYVASHDLKAPLQGIRQLANWIAQDLEGKLDKQTQSYIDLMQNRISRLEKLLEDLLAYSRLGWNDGEFTTVNVSVMVEEVFTLLNPPETFQVQCISKLPLFKTLKTPFELIIRNLINNAIKHCDHNDGVIEISAQSIDGFYEFSISDNGPGIAPEHHDRVFGIFQTLKPRDEVEGSGIGLSMVKKLISRYGCSIKIVSDGARGTKFLFTWPMENKLRRLLDE